MARFKKLTATQNLRLVTFESAITAGLLSMSIMVPFFYSISLDNAEVALSQALYTVVVSLLNLPMGWVADRLSRKWANVIGDFGCACGFLLYASVSSFAGVVFCECWLGIFMSLSQGVDLALLKHFSAQISAEPEYFRRKNARLTLWQNICSLLITSLGGPLGAINFRLAIALASVPHFLGAIASLLIQDDSEKLQPTYANPCSDMVRIIRTSFQKPRLRWRLVAYAVGREMTHGIIWVLTPILLLAGVPLAIVSVAWALDSLARILGARLALSYASKLRASQVFAIPLLLMVISMSFLTFKINLFTVSFYFLMSITNGWVASTLMPLIQEETPAAEQTTVISLAKVLGQALYIPTVLVIGWAADLHLRYAALATVAIFLPLGLIVLRQLRRE